MMKRGILLLLLCALCPVGLAFSEETPRVSFRIDVSRAKGRPSSGDSLSYEAWAWNGCERRKGKVAFEQMTAYSFLPDGGVVHDVLVLIGELDFPDDGQIWFWEVSLSLPDSLYNSGWHCRLMNMPGERLAVQAKVTDSNRVEFREIQGSPMFEKWLDYLPLLKTARNEMQEDSLKQLYIRRHPNDELSLMLSVELQNNDSLAFYYSSLPMSLREGRYGSLAWLPVKTKYLFGDFGRGDDGTLRPIVAARDFTLPVLSGDSLRLSSLFGQGKYILLDFWLPGEWSEPDLPYLKEYYWKYADRLEIIGVTTAGSREEAEQAVGRKAVPWPVMWGGAKAGSQVLGLYSECGEIGNRVLIDPQGRWVQWFRYSSATGHGVSESLYRALDALLGIER
ncbi:MAG: TlpA family protein disulfide reductase [Rikenellaceae bacterium]|nr:TlpA family protein disulfide reductase [Rikenellaceae bacterium]